MNNNDEIAKEMMDIVMEVYEYARNNNLDITNKEEVTKILRTIRSEEADNIDVDKLILGLVAFDRMGKTEAAKKKVSEKN